MSAGVPHILHVFSTFVPAGPQVRTAGLLAAFGGEFRHSLVAMDGRLEARELVAPTVEIEYLDAPPKAGSLATLRRMRALVRRTAPDLVLTYNFGAIDTALALRLPALPPWRGRPPLVHHEDGFRPDEVEGLKSRRNWLRRLALAQAAGVVVISENLQRIAASAWHLPAERLQFIPNGIDAARFEPRDDQDQRTRMLRAELGIPADAFVVGAVGHLRPEKNLARLLRAAARVPGLHVLVLGEGPERAGLEQLASGSELAGRVHFAGYHADPRGHYHALDAFALSSDTEQMPIALLEAMASSLPAVATDVGDVRAILPPEQTGQIIGLGSAVSTGQGGTADTGGSTDHEAFAEALAGLARDPQLCARLGSANRARLLERFGEQRMVQAYRELYLRALGR